MGTGREPLNVSRGLGEEDPGGLVMGPGQSKGLGHSENSAVCSNQERRGGGFVWGDSM